MVGRFDIITFGSATWDIYIAPEKMNLISSDEFCSGKAIAFNLGSKINLKETGFNIGEAELTLPLLLDVKVLRLRI